MTDFFQLAVFISEKYAAPKDDSFHAPSSPYYSYGDRRKSTAHDLREAYAAGVPPPPRREIIFVQEPVTLFTIHFYLLPRVSLPRPKEIVTTLGGVKGVWGLRTK